MVSRALLLLALVFGIPLLNGESAAQLLGDEKAIWTSKGWGPFPISHAPRSKDNVLTFPFRSGAFLVGLDLAVPRATIGFNLPEVRAFFVNGYDFRCGPFSGRSAHWRFTSAEIGTEDVEVTENGQATRKKALAVRVEGQGGPCGASADRFEARNVILFRARHNELLVDDNRLYFSSPNPALQGLVEKEVEAALRGSVAAAVKEFSRSNYFRMALPEMFERYMHSIVSARLVDDSGIIELVVESRAFGTNLPEAIRNGSRKHNPFVSVRLSKVCCSTNSAVRNEGWVEPENGIP